MLDAVEWTFVQTASFEARANMRVDIDEIAHSEGWSDAKIREQSSVGGVPYLNKWMGD